MRRRNRVLSAITVAGVAAVSLVGCSPSPTREEAQERFAIEIAARFDQDKSDPAIRGAAQDLADDAVNGRCTDADYWRLATSPLNEDAWDADLQYVWAAGCSVLFQGSLSADLEAEYKDAIIAGVIGG